jgi:hypothetical protein
MYDENYNAVAGLRDHQITPVSGLNPWAQPVKDKAENGTKHYMYNINRQLYYPSESALPLGTRMPRTTRFSPTPLTFLSLSLSPV